MSNKGKKGKIGHAAPSAKAVYSLFGNKWGKLLAYGIAGHHAGLPDWSSGSNRDLECRLKQAQTVADAELIAQEVLDLIAAHKPNKLPWQFEKKSLDVSLYIRMLFSCLVDADFLSTERYMNPENAEMRGGYSSMKEILERFNRYMVENSFESENSDTDGQKRDINESSGPDKNNVNALRASVLADCRKAGRNGGVGVYSLTVPTGGGKTLSSLAFALEHAVANNLERIIYVIPYTSIIEQNADVFRSAVGDENVVEHHSNFDLNKKTDSKKDSGEESDNEELSDEMKKLQFATENWDAPVIVTTAVRFFETLFAVRTSACRRLHNICNSVVVLDEAQLVPIKHLTPILDTIRLLSKRYRTTFVISTATQPAWESREGFNGLPSGGVKEIIHDVPALFNALVRVRIHYPDNYDVPITYEELAEKLKRHDQVLCIMPTKRSCRTLHKLLPKDFYHLSALMCGEHRSDIIAEIKEKLKNNQPVRVVSTNLVEAGVDIDFPVVYKALAGMDSMAQAAGRCNREGKLSGMGEVYLFIPLEKPPKGELRIAADESLTLLKTGGYSPLDVKTYEAFFRSVIWGAHTTDKGDVMTALTKDAPDLTVQFRTAADNFKIIENEEQYTIFVPYKESGRELIALLKKKGPEKWLLRKLQRYTVSIYERDYRRLKSEGRIIEVYPEFFMCLDTEYDLRTGLKVDDEPYDPNELMC
ncbi:CRISPR-associated helicase Cas3 [Fibrobacteres bacterium R8-0-B4]